MHYALSVVNAPSWFYPSRSPYERQSCTAARGLTSRALYLTFPRRTHRTFSVFAGAIKLQENTNAIATDPSSFWHAATMDGLCCHDCGLSFRYPSKFGRHLESRSHKLFAGRRQLTRVETATDSPTKTTSSSTLAEPPVRESVWEKDEEEWTDSGKDIPSGTCELYVTIKVVASCTLYLCVCVCVCVCWSRYSANWEWGGWGLDLWRRKGCSLWYGLNLLYNLTYAVVFFLLTSSTFPWVYRFDFTAKWEWRRWGLDH